MTHLRINLKIVSVNVGAGWLLSRASVETYHNGGGVMAGAMAKKSNL